MNGQWAALLGVAGILSACQQLPSFNDDGTKPEAAVPRVSDIVDKVQCEIAQAIVSHKADSQYAVAVNLTLEVTNRQGVNPSLSIIDPMGTGFSALIAPQVNGEQHRTFNVTFTQVVDSTSAPDAITRACKPDGVKFGLRGSLGLSEIIGTGLFYTNHNSDQADSPYKLHVLAMSPDASKTSPLTGSDTLAPSFATQIDFTLLYGLGGGPNWSVATFNGPSGSGSLVNFTRTNKDTLILSFARVPPAEKDGKGIHESQQRAGRVAQENVTRLLLQRLLPIR